MSVNITRCCLPNTCHCSTAHWLLYVCHKTYLSLLYHYYMLPSKCWTLSHKYQKIMNKKVWF